MNRRRFHEALHDGSLGLTTDHLQAAHAEARKQNIALRDALVQLGLIEEENFLRRAADLAEVDFALPHERPIDPEALAALSAQKVQHYRIVPLNIEDGTLVIAASDPFNVDLVEELSLLLGRPVALAFAPRESIDKAIRKHYGVGADTLEQMVDVGDATETGPDDGLDDASAARDVSVVRLVNQILTDAVEQRATDIHFEPYEDELRVRYRIDGVLREAGVPAAAKHFRHAIISRIKIISRLDIAEKRLPQDGRTQVTVAGRHYDLRVSILPTSYGQAAGIRILPRGMMAADLAGLGIEGNDLDGLNQLIQRPHGIILVTGPTGSGKTTTLYTALGILNRPETKILTIEDPIEYRMRGITQMQVLPEISFTFARALRSMLRHDPDIMLIGEIRDLETAQITIRTALTGHLVFSTLHTNDAASAVTRLLDMGVEPFLIASSVEGVLAQRLVRLVCKHCSRQYKPSRELVDDLKLDLPPDARFARGEGCRECRYTGYYGRTAISELLLMNEEIRAMTTARHHAADIRDAAIRAGMCSLIQSGVAKILRGETTPEEVLRVATAGPTEDMDTGNGGPPDGT